MYLCKVKAIKQRHKNKEMKAYYQNQEVEILGANSANLITSAGTVPAASVTAKSGKSIFTPVAADEEKEGGWDCIFTDELYDSLPQAVDHLRVIIAETAAL